MTLFHKHDDATIGRSIRHLMEQGGGVINVDGHWWMISKRPPIVPIDLTRNREES